MSTDSSRLVDLLRQLVLRGCTATELARLVEDYTNCLPPDDAVEFVSDAFGVNAKYLRAAYMKAHPLDASILNASLLTDIVANREQWQPPETREECWIDKVYVDPPSDDGGVPPFGISPDTWENFSDADKGRLRTASRTSQILSYRCAVLAVLSERLQLMYNEKSP